MNQQGEFLYHAPCENCGSSDAKAVYDSGTAFCFSCKTWSRIDGEGNVPTKERRRNPMLINDGHYRPLNKRKLKEDTCRKFNYLCGQHRDNHVQIACYYRNGEVVAQKIKTHYKHRAYLYYHCTTILPRKSDYRLISKHMVR